MQLRALSLTKETRQYSKYNTVAVVQVDGMEMRQVHNRRLGNTSCHCCPTFMN